MSVFNFLSCPITASVLTSLCSTPNSLNIELKLFCRNSSILEIKSKSSTFNLYCFLSGEYSLIAEFAICIAYIALAKLASLERSNAFLLRELICLSNSSISNCLLTVGDSSCNCFNSFLKAISSANLLVVFLR